MKMIHYPHFAVSNLVLTSGYSEKMGRHGLVLRYHHEDELEQCVRRVLLRKPERLRGCDLRFLRHGLNLSQPEFGRLTGKNAQTVARWEKTDKPIPALVDFAIRSRFAARFEPEMSVRELQSYVDGSSPKLPEKILLSLSQDGWTFTLDTQIKVVHSNIATDAFMDFLLDKPRASIVNFNPQFAWATEVTFFGKDVAGQFQALIEVLQDAVPSVSEARDEKHKLRFAASTKGTINVEANTIH